ncbi:O-antigen ligase family protein [Pollutimonas sp. H1-120]|uniref:O-antigen ligase family protein n=1 Tax=Pollutimonas sp. H1-120 TaxID=3148824 RepID=UPI003B52410A
MINDSLPGQRWQSLTSLGVFVFFSMAFAIPSGYSFGAALLLLTSLAYLLSRPALQPSTEDRALAYLLLVVFLVALSAFLIHGNKPKTLDQSSRYLLCIPILLLMLKAPPAARTLWCGLIIGAISAFGLALWQRFTEGSYRPDGYMTSAIPFGNISLTAGILCLAGFTWAKTQGRHASLWKIALCLGFAAGLCVSLLSGSRGGWLAIPAVLILYAIAFLGNSSMKHVAISTFLLAALLISAGFIMQRQIINRFDAAITEVNDYATNGNASTSIGMRLEAWRAAVISIGEKPVLGWSYKDYDAHLEQLTAEQKTKASITTLSNTHNNFIEVWLHQGLFGFLGLLALFMVPFWFFYKRLRSSDPAVQAFAIGGACLLACFFIFSLTQVILGRNNGIVFFGLTLVIFWGCMRNAEQRIQR